MDDTTETSALSEIGRATTTVMFGWVELDGVLYCVAHDGIIDELSCRQNREGDVVCDQWDEYDDVCRMVPLFIRVVEDDRG